MPSSQRVVVAGGGRVGERTASLLNERGHAVVLVEREADRAESLNSEQVATIINGDATRRSVLEQADLEQADAIAALTSDPGTNLAVCLLARDLAGDDLFTLARTEREGQREYTEDVDAAVLPQQLLANRAVDLLVGGEIRTFSGPDGGFEVLELAVAEDAAVAGHALEEVGLPEGCRVVGSVTEGRLAGPDLAFQAEHRYLVAVETGAIDEVRAMFRG